VDNISTVHFAAFPLGEFAAGAYCGMCVEVSYDGYSIVATVVDACGSCNAGHIDLSLSAAEALGMTGWNGNPKTGVTWRAVGCPATGEIVATFNGGYQGQVYFQNVAFPIASAVAAGRTATMNNAFWDFGVVVAGEQVTLTDVVGHQVTGPSRSRRAAAASARSSSCPVSRQAAARPFAALTRSLSRARRSRAGLTSDRGRRRRRDRRDRRRIEAVPPTRSRRGWPRAAGTRGGEGGGRRPATSGGAARRELGYRASQHARRGGGAGW
jgi:hypothetical protein